jgi:hypothetical protein
MDIDGKEIAWAAGIFEGEGCMSLADGAGRPHRWRLKVSMADEDVVRRLHDTVGIGRVNGPYNSRRLKKDGTPVKPQWNWEAGPGFEKVQFVLVMFWPWLGARRKQKVREVLTSYQRP